MQSTDQNGLRVRRTCLGAAFLGVIGTILSLPAFAEDHGTSPLRRRLTRDILDTSLELGKRFLLNNQRPEGNFIYAYDFVTREFSRDDSQVRQAGALWGLTLIHQDSPSEETAQAIVRGLRFFDTNSRQTPEGRKYIVYPGDRQGQTGTVALVTLALVDFLRAEAQVSDRTKYEADLGRYIAFLRSLRMSNGQFYGQYRHENGVPMGSPSPYYDGEALLALTKAAKYAGRAELKPVVLESAETMYVKNVADARRTDRDSPTTKGFYQWGSMAFYELYTAGWPGVEPYAQRTIDLAYWMIDVHRTLDRTRNTAYAHEGMLSAWELARLTGNQQAMDKIGGVIDAGLYKLTSWQVGGPLQNAFLKQYRTDDPRAVGGVLNCKDEPNLRIDVTQHQMHAVILARRYIYRDIGGLGMAGESRAHLPHRKTHQVQSVSGATVILPQHYGRALTRPKIALRELLTQYGPIAGIWCLHQ